MTDTHTHIYIPDSEEEPKVILERALASGVRRMVFPNVDQESVSQIRALHSAYPSQTKIAIGLHPTEVDENWESIVDEMEHILDSEGWNAVGEVGIDLYWDASKAQLQKEAFSRQVDIAAARDIPVIIHCRDGLDLTLEVLASKDRDSLPPLIFHSFTSGPESAKRIREICDPWFGINGVVTFKNARELRESLPEIGLDRILLETDSPWLAPVPHRGKRNESAYLKYVRDCVASVLGETPEHVERITDMNAEKVFGF